jgi:hypothetical protein
VEPKAKRPREIFDELVSMLPKDLKTDEVTSLKERVIEALLNGFTLDRSTKQRLSAIDPGDRYKEVMKVLDVKIVDDRERDTGPTDIEEPEEQWVHEEDEEKSDERWVSDGDTVVGEHPGRSGEALECFEIIRNQSSPETHAGPTGESEPYIASYYPIIGVFSAKEELDNALKKSQRPGEMAKIELQRFDNFDRAMGALQGKFPNHTMRALNDYQMGETKAETWTASIPEVAFLLEGLLLVVVVAGAVLQPGDKSGGLPGVDAVKLPNGGLPKGGGHRQTDMVQDTRSNPE